MINFFNSYSNLDEVVSIGYLNYFKSEWKFLSQITDQAVSDASILLDIRNIDEFDINNFNLYSKVEWRDLEGNEGIIHDWIPLTDNVTLYEKYLDNKDENWFFKVFKYSPSPLIITVSVKQIKGTTEIE